MLPSLPALATLLLLAGCSAVTAADQGGDPHQPVEEVGTFVGEELTPTLFEWLYDSTRTHLTICANQSLLSEGEVLKTNITLVYQIAGGNQSNIEGEVLEENNTCALFIEDAQAPFPLSKNETEYYLSLIVYNGTNNIFRAGSVTFAMPVEISTVSCHDQPYTRAAGVTDNITFVPSHHCTNDTADDDVCYLEGEFSSSFLCFNINSEPDLQVCLQNASLANATEVPGELTISYLAYENTKHPADAHLSLEFEGRDAEEDMEALIWKDGVPSSVTRCTENNCPISMFVPGYEQYNVCAVALTDGQPVNTSTSSVTDLNAKAFQYSGSPLVQFDYSNANDERRYIAYQLRYPIPKIDTANATVDCSGVPSNRLCRGYFEAPCNGAFYFGVEYADSAKDAMGNKILFPCSTINLSRH